MPEQKNGQNTLNNKILQRIMAQKENVAQGLGPTGEFPAGKMRDDDEGGTTLAIGSAEGRVIIDFGIEIKWIGMYPKEAEAIANSLLAHAERARAQEVT